jgi:hypothetical protein
VLAQLNGQQIHDAGDIPVFEFGPNFIADVAAVLDRRGSLAISITERHMYFTVGDRSFETDISEHRLS